MILDIIIGIIVLIFAVLGIYRGFIYTFIHTAGWLISIVLAYMATPFVNEYVLKKTDFFKIFFSDKVLATNLPAVLSKDIQTLTANMLFSILLFFVLVVVIRIVMAILLHFYTKSMRGGFVKKIDSFFGLFIGAAQGAIIVFFLLLVAMPLAEIFYPELIGLFNKQLALSYVTKYLYDNNLMWLVMETVL